MLIWVGRKGTEVCYKDGGSSTEGRGTETPSWEEDMPSRVMREQGMKKSGEFC